jgi:hypothetical protein
MTGEYIDSDKPFTERDITILKYTAHFHAKYFIAFRIGAFVPFALTDVVHLVMVAIRTNGLTAPTLLSKILYARLLIFKVSEQVCKVLKLCYHSSNIYYDANIIQFT